MEDITIQKLELVEGLLNVLGKVQCRALFGGYSLTIDKTAFGMLVEGEFFLRACERSADYFTKRNASKLHFTRRGRDICLNYYQVDNELLEQPELLLDLASSSLNSAAEDLLKREQCPRVKDLPNLTLQIELWLSEAGINDVETLKAFGAKQCWLKLRAIKKSLGLKTLYALEGAIVGMHEAALPADKRRELYDWFSQQSLTKPPYSGKNDT